MKKTIAPTKENPLILLTRQKGSTSTFLKLWVEPTKHEFYNSQHLYRSTCTVEESNATQSWSKPKLDPTTKLPCLVIVTLSESTNSVTTKVFHQPAIQTTDLQKEENFKFANSPELVLSLYQARILRQFLDYQYMDKPVGKSNKSVGMQKFLKNWPNLDSGNPYEKDTAFPTFPNSTVLATELFLSTKANASTQTPSSPAQPASPYSPPNPQFLPNLPRNIPFPPAPLSIHNHHSYTIPKSQPSGLYSVTILCTEKTATKTRREVVYAIPSESSAKNPNKEPLALCPLKSTVAILFYDANQDSPTYLQPIVQSINTETATPQQLEQFLQDYKQHLSPTQLLQFTNQPTQQDTAMPNSENHSTSLCKYCGNQFHTTRSTNHYCSPSCRINFNNGKVFGETKASRQAANPPSQPQEIPTHQSTKQLLEQQTQALLALGAQIGTLVTLLTPKD